MWWTSLDDHDYAVVEAMTLYGGSFVVALARAFSSADAENFAKLKAAFPEYWEKYREVARTHRLIAP